MKSSQILVSLADKGKTFFVGKVVYTLSLVVHEHWVAVSIWVAF